LEIYERSNLTKAQLVFWLGQKLSPDVPLYNNALGLIIPIALDATAFQRAFRKLVQSSDALRTVIDIVDGVPFQRVLPQSDFEFELLDFSDASDPVPYFEEWAQERCHRMFDFSERLFDSALIKLGDEKYVWYFAQHHIICDAFSQLITMRFLDEFYARAVDGTLDNAPAIPPFLDYVNHELAHRGSNASAQELEYWEKKRAIPADPLAFYGIVARRTVGPVSHRRCDLGPERSERIRNLAFHEDVATKTPFAATFNIFAAILATYLHRMSGIRNVSIGMPFHNRRPDAHKQTIGIFIGVLPLRVTIDDGDTMFSLIKKVAADASTSLRNSAAYLHNLVNTQAHDVMLNYLLWTVPDFQGTPCEIRWIHSGFGSDPLVIIFYTHPVTGNLGITFDFNSTLFDDETQQRTIDQMLHTMDRMLENPSLPLNQVELLSADERRFLEQDLNRTDSPLPPYETAHAWFERQAQLTPDAIAVAFDSEALTYVALNRRANQIAHYLRAQGVVPETLVGLCMDRSFDMVAGMLGILKSGSAYVPLDPGYPPERLAFMIRDSQTQLLLTQQPVLDLLPASGARTICIDRDWESISPCSTENPAPNTGPRNLAYVIYTSGSTGTPKGALLEHRGLCNLIDAQTRCFGVDHTCRVLQFASLSFDASVSEIFMALCTGATLYLARQADMASADDLLRVLRDQQITIVTLPPSVLKVLDASQMPDLRTIVAAGEACPASVVEKWSPGRDFFNAYGPTETTVCASIARCNAGAAGYPPIGKPIANTRMYVLDESMRIVPPGVAGELYIGGIGVARGYWKRDDLTKQRFVPDPFGEQYGERLYRTGDRARYRANGEIEFLGRLDHQVKVRGYRIELGEIEACISQHPEVSDSVVVAREDVPDDHRLVAYVVMKSNGKSHNGELKSFLRQTLPEYMVPTAFVALDELPLTPNGKIDRNALPHPTRSARNVAGVAQAPRDSLELELAHVWEHVLDVRPVGVTDNFFDLGGHSLSAVQLMDEIERKFGQRLAPARLFEAPTIERLAGILRSDTSISDSIVVPIRPEGSKPPFFCVHPAPGTVFCYAPIAQHMDADRPFYGLQAPAINGVGRVFDTIEETATCYIEAMRSVRPEGPYHIGGHSSGGAIAFEMARQLEREGHEVGVVVLMDSFAPLPAPRSDVLYGLLLEFADEAMWLASVLMMVEYFFATPISLRYRELRKLDRDAQYAAVLAELKRVGFLAPSAGPGAIHGLVENCRAGMEASMRYCPEPYAGRVAYLYTSGYFAVIPEDSFIPSVRQLWQMLKRDWRTIVRGTPQLIRDMVITSARSGLLRRWMTDRTLGWKPYARGPIDMLPVPGNHISMLADPDAAGVAAQIQRCLDAWDVASEPEVGRTFEASSVL
jgi:amino acid adenylation domain-containing protein